MLPRAVLFDFDGVLADTENVHIAAWERTFAAMGWEVPPEVCARAAEEDDRLFLAAVFAARGVRDGDVAGWVRRKQELTIAMLTASPRLYPGVVELVRALAERRVKLAVVSGTWRENVEAVLNARGLADAFRLVIGKEDAKAPKPDPEPYVLALKKMRVAGSSAVALEDSPTGLASAAAGNVRRVAVGHRRPEGEWAEGATYLPDLIDTAKVLSALGFGEPA